MNLKRQINRTCKDICLECQTHIGNCKASCLGTSRFSVSTSFRPPKIGSSKWKLIEKVIRKRACTEKELPTDIVCSASFSRNTWVYRNFKGRPPKSIRERGYLESRLGE